MTSVRSVPWKPCSSTITAKVSCTLRRGFRVAFLYTRVGTYYYFLIVKISSHKRICSDVSTHAFTGFGNSKNLLPFPCLAESSLPPPPLPAPHRFGFHSETRVFNEITLYLCLNIHFDYVFFFTIREKK